MKQCGINYFMEFDLNYSINNYINEICNKILLNERT